jgi:ketosteroid isomerase-like protein
VSELDEFLKTVLPRQIQADNALLNGDPEPRTDLWSHRDPVTVLGARRAASGWDQVSESFRWIASRFTNGEFHLEVIAAEASGDLAYTVGYERSRASLDGGPVGPIRLRVTHVYRRENGEWKIVHRHADPLDTEQVTPTAEQP